MSRRFPAVAASVAAAVLVFAMPSAHAGAAPTRLVPQGYSYWQGNGEVMQMHLSGSVLKRADTPGTDLGCSRGTLQGSTWRGRTAIVDGPGFNLSRDVYSGSSSRIKVRTEYKYGTYTTTWRRVTAKQATAYLSNHLGWHTSATRLIEYCKFNGSAWRA